MTTRHAAERWQQRIEDVPIGIAFRHLVEDAESGIPIPTWIAKKFHPFILRKRKQRRSDFLVTPRSMIVLQQGTMVTVLPFSFEAYICVLVWKLFGCLPLEHPEWGRLPTND